MKKGLSIISGILLAVAVYTPAMAAGHGHGKGPGGGDEKESQAGGLPALEDRVEADEALITTLQGQATDLLGQNNWAVVAADGTVVRSSSIKGPVATTHVAGTGVYEVSFGKDVSGCAYQATIGDTAKAVPTQGQISVSGDVDGNSPNDVYVQTFDPTGLIATDSSFHLLVSCQ